MKYTLSIASLALVAASLLAANAFEKPEKQFNWKVHVINADSPFEAAGIGDINNDGLKDIVCGAYWYEAPDWTPHKIAELEEISGYYNDFANELMDVDNDGDLDIVNCAWFSKSIFWRENPMNTDQLWETHTIDEAGNMETGFLFDFDQDGKKDFVPDISHEVAWYQYDIDEQQNPSWLKRPVGTEGRGHGIGFGDINGDGLNDFICPPGWYETKKEGDSFSWTFHPEFQLGTASVPILAYDVNKDGLMDIVWGMGHDYGLNWLEQVDNNGKREWKQHSIDQSWSQAHYIAIEDLNGDGEKELIAGKRYWAHNGGDPGANDPLCLYIYTYNIETQQWHRETVYEGGPVGFGLNPALDDIDGDGDIDIVCSGKSGLYLLEQI